MEAGVKFWLAGGVRGQVAGSLPRKATRHWYQEGKGGVVTPSHHPEVPGTRFASRGGVLGIRQSMGWTKASPELVCYLPILTTFGWNGGSRVHTRPPGLRQGTTVCVHTSMDMEQLSDHKLITPSGMGLLVCVAGSHIRLAQRQQALVRPTVFA